MPAPLSNDLRKRIVEARERGDTVKKIAREKNVGERTVFSIMALYRQTKRFAPRPLNNGRKPRLGAEPLESIRAAIRVRPDISLSELIDELKLPISESALCRIVNNKLGLRRKKNASRL